MRRWFPLLTASFVALAAASQVTAAPTCWNGVAEVVRCGTPGALPVGSRLTPAQAALRQARAAQAPAAGPPLFGLALLLAGLFGLIALLPDFEGWDRR